VEFAFLNLFP